MTHEGPSARGWAVAAFWATLTLAALDLVLALTVPGPRSNSFEGSWVWMATLMAQGAILGSGLFVLVWLVARVTKGPGHGVPLLGRFPVTALLLSGSAIAAFEVFNWRLFQGAGIRQASWARGAELAFRILGGLGVGAAMLIAWRLGAILAVKTPRVRRALAAVLLAAAAALLWFHAHNRFATNANYDTQLLQLVLAAWALLFLSTIAWTGGRPPRGRWAFAKGGLIVLLPTLGLLARGLDDFRSLKAPVVRARAMARVGPWADRVLGFVVDPKAPRATNVRELMTRYLAADPKEIQKTLDGAAPDRRDFNVLWIAMDTVRADHVSFLGYRRPTTRSLDELARRSFVFANAYTPYPTSSFAYSSILSSLAPRISRVFSVLYEREWEFPDPLTLPALLGSRGWTTSGITAFDRATAQNPRWFGTLTEGFGEYNVGQTDAGFTAPETVQAFRSFLDRSRGKKWFCWAHFLAPHAPYVRHEEFPFGEEIIDAYDSEIAWTDHHVGLMLEALREHGLDSKTVVVVFSDHGEEFLEHGGNDHDSSVYEEQIHVPLLIFVPGFSGRRIESTVSLMDLFPTTTRLLSIDDAGRRLGRSLLQIMLSGEDPDGGIAYSEHFRIRLGEFSKDQRAVIQGRKKLISRVHLETVEAYDLERDPGEREPASHLANDDQPRLQGLLEAWRERIASYHAGAVTAAPTVDLSTEVSAILTALETGKKSPDDGVSELQRLLYNGYWILHPHVRRKLGDEGLWRVWQRLRAICTNPEIPRRHALLRLLEWSRDARLREFWHELLASKKAPTWPCVNALSLLGDDHGRELLHQSLQDHRLIPRQDIANALGRLGDMRALPWIYLNVNVQKFGRMFREAILALPALDAAVHPRSAWLRDRVFEEDYRHPEVNDAILDVLADQSDDDAKLIVLRLCRDKEVPVRERAMDRARQLFSEQELKRNLGAMDHELEADLASVYGGERFADACEHYRRAVENSTLPNLYARLRWARALYGSGRSDDADRLLDEVFAHPNATAQDRSLAPRFKLLGKPMPDFGDLAVDVQGTLRIPDGIRPKAGFPVTVQLKNGGKHGFSGGWYRPTYRLRIGWLDEQGALVPTAVLREESNPLPTVGILAGETVTLTLLAVAPLEPGRYTPVLIFSSSLGELPHSGIVHTGKDALEIR